MYVIAKQVNDGIQFGVSKNPATEGELLGWHRCADEEVATRLLRFIVATLDGFCIGDGLFMDRWESRVIAYSLNMNVYCVFMVPSAIAAQVARYEGETLEEMEEWISNRLD